MFFRVFWSSRSYKDVKNKDVKNKDVKKSQQSEINQGVARTRGESKKAYKKFPELKKKVKLLSLASKIF